jgi:hypothetical protein
MIGAEVGSKLRRLWSREDEWESDDPDDKMGALMMNSRTYAASGCGINHPSVVFWLLAALWFIQSHTVTRYFTLAGMLHYDAKRRP